MVLEVDKTYVYINEAAKNNYIDNAAANKHYNSHFYNDGFKLAAVESSNGYMGNKPVIGLYEMQFFKLKEINMLKPDDVMTIEMTALDAVRVKTLLGASLSDNRTQLLETLNDKLESLGDMSEVLDMRFSELKDFQISSNFYATCLALFPDPNQAKLDALQKTIDDATAQIAAIKLGPDNG